MWHNRSTREWPMFEIPASVLQCHQKWSQWWDIQPHAIDMTGVTKTKETTNRKEKTLSFFLSGRHFI